MIYKNKNRNIDYDKIFEESIVLIGPMSTGKTTIAEELLKKEELKKKLYYLPLDEFSSVHLSRLGYSSQKGKEIYNGKDYESYLKYRQPYNFKYVKYILDTIDRPMLLEFGGGDTLTTTKEDYEELKECLSEFKNVVLILPSKDNKSSLKILEERWNEKDRGKYSIGELEDIVNWTVINNGINDELANITVYTEEKTPTEVAEEILELIGEKKHII